MRNYYFLSNALPELEVHSKPVISFPDLMVLFQENLSEGDLKQVKVLRLFYDILNIQRMLEHEGRDFRAHLSENELKSALVHHEFFPSYVFDYMDRYGEGEEQVEHFPELIASYYRVESETNDPASDILRFERKLRLYLVAYRARRRGDDLAEALYFEDSADPLVDELLHAKDLDSLDLGDDLQGLGELLATCEGKPMEEDEAIAKFRFSFYMNYKVGHPFSLHFLLSFMMRLMILEDFEMHDRERGEKLLNTILKDSA